MVPCYLFAKLHLIHPKTSKLQSAQNKKTACLRRFLISFTYFLFKQIDRLRRVEAKVKIKKSKNSIHSHAFQNNIFYVACQ